MTSPNVRQGTATANYPSEDLFKAQINSDNVVIRAYDEVGYSVETVEAKEPVTAIIRHFEKRTGTVVPR